MKPALSTQKLRGGYYTPKPIADFLAHWVIQSPTAHILEPSCGDGALLEAAASVLLGLGASKEQAANSIYGVEIDNAERLKALERLRKLGFPCDSKVIHNGDFFAYCKSYLKDDGLLAVCDDRESKHYDAIIGNPPFIRYQNFSEEQRIPAFEIMSRAGLKPSRLTNTWVPFLVGSSFLLKDNGRLGMIIPAELLQVNYAAELRQFLSTFYNKITLITFRKLVFAGIQQEVVLFLGEHNSDQKTGIRTIQLDCIDDLENYEHLEFSDQELKPLDHSKEKWTQYFLDNEEIELLRKIKLNPALTESGKVIDVDVGVVTGLNEFFVLNKEKIKELSLEKYTKPIVSRSAHLKGVIFSKDNWNDNVESNYATYLLSLPDVPFEELPKFAQTYIQSGETSGINGGYKCRIRNRWYIVPSTWVPDAFMLRQVHSYPKIIINNANSTCTDTIHRIRLLNGISADVIAAAFLNSLTFAFSEVIGRSYGGGVLELEPREAENLPLPLENTSNLNLQEIHDLILKDDINAVLDITDKVLLIDGLGLKRKEVNALRKIWEKLRDRRINRKHTSKKKK